VKEYTNNWPLNQRAWHCDGLADTSPPPDLSTMRCLATPHHGGETLFASSVKAAESLPVNELIDEFGIHPENALVSTNYLTSTELLRKVLIYYMRGDQKDRQIMDGM
jgi:alpha-ketoglutarate-dependent taurine dioxygenase